MTLLDFYTGLNLREYGKRNKVVVTGEAEQKENGFFLVLVILQLIVPLRPRVVTKQGILLFLTVASLLIVITRTRTIYFYFM